MIEDPYTLEEVASILNMTPSYINMVAGSLDIGIGLDGIRLFSKDDIAEIREVVDRAKTIRERLNPNAQE